MSPKSRCSTKAVMLALIVLLATSYAQEVYSVNYNAAEQFNTTTVTGADASNIKSYSIGGWIRPSMAMDFEYPWSVFSANEGLIMGATTSKTGYGDSLLLSDSFLVISQSSWSVGSGIILYFDNNKVKDSIRININYSTYFGVWFYVYGAYIQSSGKVYLSVYNLRTNTIEEVSKTGVARNPIVDYFQFSVGSADVSKQYLFNGYAQYPSFKYKSGETYHEASANVLQQINNNASKEVKEVINESSRVQEIVVANQQLYYATYFLGNPYSRGQNEEYLLEGLYKLQQGHNTGTFLVARLSARGPSSKLGSSYLPQDRILAFFFENGWPAFVTYTMTEKEGPKEVKVNLRDGVANIVGRNFYYYIGYSRSLKSVFYYMVGENGYFRVSGTITNVVHPDNYYQYVYYNSDSIQNNPGGNIQSVSHAYGKGSYSTFLYTAPPVYSQTTLPFTFPASPSFASPQLIASSSTSNKALDVRGFNKVFLYTLTDYQVHFWYRRSLNYPNLSNLNNVRSTQQLLATVNLNGNGDSQYIQIIYSHSGSNSINYRVVAEDKTNGVAAMTPIVTEFSQVQDQGQWHWIYLGHHVTKPEVTLAVNFGNGASVVKSSKYALSTAGITDIQATLGTKGTLFGPPGEFYDFQLAYRKDTYWNTADQVDTYLKSKVNQPPASTLVLANLSYNKTNATTISIPKQNIQNSGNYSIGGWAKWNENAQKNANGNVVFLLSINDPVTDKNPARLGDNALSIVIKDKQVIFNTYHLGYTSNLDKTLSQTIDTGNIDGQWCLYYFSYQRSSQTASGSISCEEGFSKTFTLSNVDHIVPQQGTLFVGAASGFTSFDGDFYNPFFGNQGETSVPRSVSDNTPPVEFECVTVFSKCGYKSVLYSICDDTPNINLKEIRSIYIPTDTSVSFYRQKNYNGLSVKFIASVQCLEGTLISSPEVKWAELQKLFTQGQIEFSDSEGNGVSLEQAHAIFFGEEYVPTQTLRKNTKRHHQNI